MEIYNLNWRFVGKLLFCSIAFLFSANVGFAQLKLVPIGQGNYDLPEVVTNRSARTQALSIPFFDDFSTTASAHPDSSFWMPGSGVYINNTLATTQPSVNMATFDGLNASGVPYSFTSQRDRGNSDTLTSQPINLAGLNPADSVYLSFYWLARGLGELPDDNDTLRLEFLNQDQQWISVWSTTGPLFDTLFTRQFVAVTEPAFLHGAFQFRFRSYGRVSGPYDTWHIDYLYLNKNRSVKDRYIKDVTVRKPLTPFLKKYTAMPLKQYRLDPVSATADSTGTDVVNLFNNFNSITYNFSVRDEISGKELQSIKSPEPNFIYEEQTQVKKVPLKPVTVEAGVKALRLKYKFALTTTDNNNPTIPSVDLTRNDSISARTELSDYYAYDDGTAEYGVRMNQRLGRAVMRFTLSEADTLKGVRLSIVPFIADLTGQSFTIQVYSDKDGVPDQVLAQKAVVIKYPVQRDSLVTYQFDSPVPLKDAFYVGWVQIGEQPLSVGFDRNSQLGSQHVFVNLGTGWAQETSLKGSIIIRPFMGGLAGETITGTEPVNNDLFFYPNPGKGTVHWQSSWIDKIEVFSVDGKLTRTIIPESGARSAGLDGLTDGMYIFKASGMKRSFAQKMLIVK